MSRALNLNQAIASMQATQDRFKQLDYLFKDIADTGVIIDSLSTEDMEQVKALANRQADIVFIHNFRKISPYFVNDFGKEYFGMESNDLSDKGKEFFETFVYPDDMVHLHKTIEFYMKNPHGTNKLCYRGKNATGEWQWLYSCDRALNFTPDGMPHYFLAMSFDITRKLSEFDHRMDVLAITMEDRQKFQMLTNREREILMLIAQDKTSKEIAEELFIEATTVETHRKHIIHKLGVRSSVGLVRYALIFS